MTENEILMFAIQNCGPIQRFLNSNQLKCKSNNLLENAVIEALYSFDLIKVQ